MATMKAVRIHEYGAVDGLKYEDAPIPTAGEGEVLIRNIASSVNPFDVAVRAGYMAGMLPYTFPLILGTDISGTVEQVGAGVTNMQAGDVVYARGGVTRDGAYAQYVVVPASDVALRPKSLDEKHAAALPHVTLTAWQALFELADLSQGQTILIHGAGGGVGHVAVQLAKWRGATVIGTASRNLDFVRSLGVDELVDYSKTPFETVVRNVDVVLDTIGGDTQQRSWQVLRPGGILVSVIQPPSEAEAAAHGVRQAMVFSSPPIGAVLTEVAGLVEAGLLKPHISAVIPLREIQRAHTLVANGHTAGKVVLQID